RMKGAAPGARRWRGTVLRASGFFCALSGVTNDADAFGARLSDPGFALAAQQLTHVGAGAIAREALKGLAFRIETYDGRGAPLRQPHLVIGIDPHGIGARAFTRQLPLLPAFFGRVVDADVARVPFADPQPALGVRPHPARALFFGWRLIN